MQVLFKSILIVILMNGSTLLIGQNPWTQTIERNIHLSENNVRYTIPTKGATFSLDIEKMAALLTNASKSDGRITLPLPDGSFESFLVNEVPVFQTELAKKYPSIKTYKGKSLTSSATARLDLTPQGFHASIRDQHRNIYIDPYAVNQNKYYIIYYLNDLLDSREDTFICGTDELSIDELKDVTFEHAEVSKRSKEGEPVTLRTYATAIAATGEFTEFHGGKENAIAAIATIINRLNQIFNAEIAINLVLINNNDKIVFTDANQDGYTNGVPDKMIDENQSIIDAIIGFGYSWGHVFGTNVSFSGLAQLGSVCTGSRARGVSTERNPIGDGFTVSIIAHEMGHQMGAAHSFSSCHNVASGSAYEPGGGSTIMSYAGICGNPVNNLVTHSDPYYFTNSLQQIKQFMFTGTGNNCAVGTATSNVAPEVEIPLTKGFFIPVSTPFELTAIASDVEGDHLTYCWEQYDLGPMSEPGSPTGNCPLFRSFPPNDSPTRIFPKIKNIINNFGRRSEVLPTYSRNLTFRCTVRDNVPEHGGTTWATIAFKSTDQAGPFTVEFPNSGKDSLIVGDFVPIKWDVSNTDLAPVNCQKVNIYLSLDGGFTFPVTLAENVPNDGTEFVEVPDMVSKKVRVKVKAADNVFFDISNFNTRISKPTSSGYSLGLEEDDFHVCLPETVDIGIVTSSFLDFSDKIQFSIVGDLPENVVASFSKNEINPGEKNTLTLDFSNHLEEGDYTVEIEGRANDTTTIVRMIHLKTTSNIFSSIELSLPVNGSEIDQLPNYQWSLATDADKYLLEVASNPSFEESTIVEFVDTLTLATVTSSILLEANSIYFWRISPINDCGVGTPIGPFSFHTTSVNCRSFDQESANLVFSQTGKPYKESVIKINESGTIADVNIPTFHGTHAWFSDLDVSLTSPAGTKIFLFNDKCLNYNGNFSFKLDDQSPNEFSCPPKGAYFRPLEALSAFNGEDIKGDWILGIQDDNAGNGGVLDGWSLELCGSISQKPPSILTNKALPVKPSASRIISSEFLSTDDSTLPPNDLEYVIIKKPMHGFIYRYGTVLSAGQSFSEWELAHGSVVYKHNGDDNEKDEFPFLVKNADNAWTGQQVFNIIMDENAEISDTKLAFDERNVRLFPNPATNEIFIEFINAKQSHATIIDLFNIQGQKLYSLVNNHDVVKIVTKDYAKGVYFVKITSGSDTITKKLIIE